jgi:hypothetical protein
MLHKTEITLQALKDVELLDIVLMNKKIVIDQPPDGNAHIWPPSNEKFT